MSVAQATTVGLRQISHSAPDKGGNALWINQDATFSMGSFDAGKDLNYQISRPENGAYIIVLEGSVKVEDQVLNKKDAFGLWEIDSVAINTLENARILIIDVPML
jgi:redox-sensitive bicupin YhaK (pirin superfamily)